MSAEVEQKKHKKPSFAGALFVILFLCVALVVQVFVLDRPWDTHITLILSSVVAIIVAMTAGYTYKECQDAILYGCQLAMLPMLILMMVGVLVGSWIPGGVIPALIYYGMQILSPGIFLATVCLICAIASVMTGSSWTTGATFGVAFMGIGMGLGIPAAMTAGAVISGAIFGDKMSPLSDSTNLGAAVGEADLFDHIKSMMYTTIPALVIALIIYAIMGLQFAEGTIDQSQVNEVLNALSAGFHISPIYFIPPILVVVLAVKRVSGLAVMIIASILGMIFAMLFQGYGLGEMIGFMNNGYVSDTGVESVDALLTRGGLQGMMWTISLGFVALSFGGILEKTKMLNVLLGSMGALLRKTGGLVTTHVISAIIINLATASQYMAIIIPGRMYRPAYKKLGLLPQVLSRTSEDAGTVFSPLVPWGLCGVFFYGCLGVPTLEYAPYTFLSFLVPIIAVIYAWVGFAMFKEGDIKSVSQYKEDDEADDLVL